MLRGAVFFIGMASWSSQRINSLIHSFVSVLPSLYAAVMYQIVVVDLEVILSVHRLVKKYGKELSAVEWDIILDMLILWVPTTHTHIYFFFQSLIQIIQIKK